MHAGKISALAVVRCGDKSLHESWSSNDGRYDIGISYFGDDEGRKFPEASFVHRGKGGKWDGLFNFFKQHPQAINAYDYFWFPDDDIAANASDINRLFEIGYRYGLDVFQPSLDDSSYYSHLITLRHPSFDLRYTNFVEIMVPVISRDILKKTLPLLEKTKSGFGMDFLWPAMAAERGVKTKSVAIVDSVTVRHTRPVGGALHQFMTKVGGNTSSDELRVTLGAAKARRNAVINGVAVPRIRILSGVDNNGVRRHGIRLVWVVAHDLMGRNANKVQPIARVAALRHAIKSMAKD